MVKAIIILEIMGGPKEHLAEAFNKHIGKLEDTKGIEIERKVISEAKPVEELKDKEIYSMFAEIELITQDVRQLTQVMFDYMPTSIEIIEPANISMNVEEATEFFNILTGRLNQYDQVAQSIQGQQKQLVHQFKIAQKLLRDNGIIDKEGKILKTGKEDKKE